MTAYLHLAPGFLQLKPGSLQLKPGFQHVKLGSLHLMPGPHNHMSGCLHLKPALLVCRRLPLRVMSRRRAEAWKRDPSLGPSLHFIAIQFGEAWAVHRNWQCDMHGRKMSSRSHGHLQRRSR